jgi:hypothetical protein
MKRLCAVLVIVTASALAQTTSDGTVQALLLEVRQLRQALEKSTLVVPKIQMTLQRMQTQQESVNRAAKELEEVRVRLAKTDAEGVNLASELKSLEFEIGREQDASRRAVLENQVKRLKTIMEQPRTVDSQLRAREGELSGRLRLEQVKLEEMNDKLNALERMLDPQPK